MNKMTGTFEYDSKNEILYIELEDSEVVYYGKKATDMAIRLAGGKIDE